MIELDPNVVSAHYIESQETGTEQIIEPISVHKAAPIEEVKVKFADEGNYKKVGHLMKDYFSIEELKYIGEKCLNMPNPLRCKAMITHTCWQETHCGKAGVGLRNNLFAVYNSHHKAFLSYNSRMDAIKEWLEKYDKYWKNNSCKQMITRSKYCVSGCNDWIEHCNMIMNRFISN